MVRGNSLFVMSVLLVSILIALSLISPKIGGFWIFFLKNKTRLNTFILNSLFLIFLVAIGYKTDSNSEKGFLALKQNRFEEAIKHFSKMEPSDKEFRQKEILIKKVLEAEAQGTNKRGIDKQDRTRWLPTVGDKLITSYFEIKLNKVWIDNKIKTGNIVSDVDAGEANLFVILDVSFKNIDNESRMIRKGALFVDCNNKMYKFEKSETIMAEGWSILLELISPLITETTKIVYKIPAEMNGPVYWEPGRNIKGTRFYCGNLMGTQSEAENGKNKN